LFSNIWKQFIPSDQGLIVDRLVIPPMVDFDSMLIGIDSLQPYYLAQQKKRGPSFPSTFYEKVFITQDMLKQSTTPSAADPVKP
jgi:hypothetical protein